MNWIKNIFKTSDELVGTWETSNEGGFQIVMGSQLIVKQNGMGKLISWGIEDEEGNSLNENRNINWRRISQNQIEIKYEDESEYEKIEYLIKNYEDGYGVKYFQLFCPTQRLGKSATKGFWMIPSELYKEKKKNWL